MFRSIGAAAWHTRSGISRTTTKQCNYRRRSSRLASMCSCSPPETPLTGSGRRSCGRLKVCRSKPRRTARHPRKNPMFKRKPSKDIQIDTLIGARTRIHGDVEFAGGLHLDGHINGDVKGASDGHAILSVSETGCIEGSVIAASVLVNGTVKGNIDAADRVELGAKAQVLGSVLYGIIETAVGARIYGKLNHRGPGTQVAGAPGGQVSA